MHKISHLALADRDVQQLSIKVLLFFLFCLPMPIATRDSTSKSKRATSVSFAAPRRRLTSNNIARCQLATVPNDLNPLAWLYAVGDDGLAEDGLPIPSLITTGYADNLVVYQWQGNDDPCFPITLCFADIN
jgi:hypothetical protein